MSANGRNKRGKEDEEGRSGHTHLDRVVREGLPEEDEVGKH